MIPPLRRHRRRRRWLLVLVPTLACALMLVAIAWRLFAPYRDVDILIVNGTVVDGTGGEPHISDIAIRNGRIIGISTWRFYFSRPKLMIEAAGKVVAPGFIDVHTHVEANVPQATAFRPANFLRQGVTTIITGNCGRSRTDVAALFNGLEKNGTYINLATLVGHNSVRQEVMGTASRRPTPQELIRMRGLVERAMQHGALGLSTGLVYSPGRFADTSELVALSEEAARRGGIYVSHIRDEGRGGVEALREALEVGRLSQAPTHISHFKCSGRTEWRTAPQRLEILNAARAAGQSVTLDVYPYDRSSTTTDVLLPDWAIRDGRAGLREVARSAETRRRLRDEILASMRESGWENLAHVRVVAGREEWIGRTLVEVPVVAAATDINRQIENLIDISLRGGAQAIYGDMSEDDVKLILGDPFCVFGSDSAVRDPEQLYKPHPRGSGTFPRVFSRYVRSERLLALAHAVRKATGQAADIFHLDGRGYLRPQAWADVVVFDPEKINDTADYDQPFAAPTGIDYVIVNGVVTVDHGNLTGAPPAGSTVARR
jgi:N-acyl-D-amino-acid deacylase